MLNFTARSEAVLAVASRSNVTILANNTRVGDALYVVVRLGDSTGRPVYQLDGVSLNVTGKCNSLRCLGSNAVWCGAEQCSGKPMGHGTVSGSD